MTNLENDLSKLLEWFKSNGMVANPKKFQLMFLGLQGTIRLRLNIEGSKVPTTGHVKLLGVEIDSKLTFNKHIETLCSKVNKKVSAFAGLNNDISREQALTVCNAVILSNFNYCPLIWLFCNKGANKKLTALINVRFGSSIKTTNLHLKHCLLEVAAIAYISKICRN